MSISQVKRPKTALTCRNLAKTLVQFGDQILFSGDWVVTGLNIKPTGEVSLYALPAELCVDAGGNPVSRLSKPMMGKFSKGGV